MSQGFEIQIFNRHENRMEIGKVYGDEMVKFAYGNPVGRLLGPVIASDLLPSAVWQGPGQFKVGAEGGALYQQLQYSHRAVSEGLFAREPH